MTFTFTFFNDITVCWKQVKTNVFGDFCWMNIQGVRERTLLQT